MSSGGGQCRRAVADHGVDARSVAFKHPRWSKPRSPNLHHDRRQGASSAWCHRLDRLCNGSLARAERPRVRNFPSDQRVSHTRTECGDRLGKPGVAPQNPPQNNGWHFESDQDTENEPSPDPGSQIKVAVEQVKGWGRLGSRFHFAKRGVIGSRFEDEGSSRE